MIFMEIELRIDAHGLCHVVFHGVRLPVGQVVYLPETQELRLLRVGVVRSPQWSQVGSC